MDIEEIKKKRLELIMKILGLINEFESDCKVTLIDFDIERDIIGSIIKINAEIKI